MDYMIRKLGPDEPELAKQLLLEWQLDDGVPDPSVPQKDYLQGLLQKEGFHLFVALKGANVLGGLTAYELPMFYREEKEMFLYEIGVGEAYRRKGIARELIEALKKECLKKGIKIIFVGTSLDNEAAQQLYALTGAELEVIPWYTYTL